MQEIEYYDAELEMSSYFCNGEWYWDKPSIYNGMDVAVYRLNGLYHREDGPAIEYASGDKEWYFDGVRHREDGPAIINVDGSIAWFVNGFKHHIDGPAIEFANGGKQWHISGLEYTEKEYLEQCKK